MCMNNLQLWGIIHCRLKENLPSEACVGLDSSIAIAFLSVFDLFSQESKWMFSANMLLSTTKET